MVIHKPKVAALYISQLSFLLHALSSLPIGIYTANLVTEPTLLHITPWEREREKPTDKKKCIICRESVELVCVLLTIPLV